MSTTQTINSTNNNHDPAGWRHLNENYRPLDHDKIEKLLAAEWERFSATTPESGSLYTLTE